MASPLLVERADSRPIHLPHLRKARHYVPHVIVWAFIILDTVGLIIGARL